MPDRFLLSASGATRAINLAPYRHRIPLGACAGDTRNTDRFTSPCKTHDLTEVLIRRGYSDEHIRKILGGTFRRLLGQTWKPVVLPA